jgi:hypothetical protein
MTDTVLLTFDALVAACVAATAAGQPLENVKVVDGTSIVSGDNANSLFVGMTIDDPTLAVEVTNGEELLPGVVESNSFSILCVAESWSGETGDQQARRARAVQTYQAMRNLLRPNATGITLGVTSLAFARIGSWSLRQAQAQKGLVVTIEFRVECMARPVVI